MGLFSFLNFGKKNEKILLLIESGGMVLDVRTKEEFVQGHVKGAVNISLNELPGQLSKLKKKNRAIVTCCASGMRSASAQRMLVSNGIEAVNGGSWYKVDNLLRK